jgi:Spy/CpxP family protein refolding chaperone
MNTRTFLRLGIATLALAACSDSTAPTQLPSAESTDELQVFAATEAAAVDGNWGGVIAQWARRCGPEGPPRLTDEQIEKIRQLKAAFQAAMADEIALIRHIYALAKEARANGASAQEIREILAEAQPAIQALREAEQRLQQAILDVLTPDQRRRWCHVAGPFSGSAG